MPKIPDQIINCENEGLLSTLAGIAGTLQSNEVIKTIINDKNKFKGSMLIFNALTLNFRKVKITKNKKCIKECLKR